MIDYLTIEVTICLLFNYTKPVTQRFSLFFHHVSWKLVVQARTLSTTHHHVQHTPSAQVVEVEAVSDLVRRSRTSIKPTCRTKRSWRCRGSALVSPSTGISFVGNHSSFTCPA